MFISETCGENDWRDQLFLKRLEARFYGLHAQCFSDEGHADWDSVEGLLEVAGLWEAVDALHDLVDARERVHERGVGLHFVDHFWGEDEGVFDLVELLDVFEAFFLHARVVDHVSGLEGFVGEFGMDRVSFV